MQHLTLKHAMLSMLAVRTAVTDSLDSMQDMRVTNLVCNLEGGGTTSYEARQADCVCCVVACLLPQLTCSDCTSKCSTGLSSTPRYFDNCYALNCERICKPASPSPSPEASMPPSKESNTQPASSSPQADLKAEPAEPSPSPAADSALAEPSPSPTVSSQAEPSPSPTTSTQAELSPSPVNSTQAEPSPSPAANPPAVEQPEGR